MGSGEVEMVLLAEVGRCVCCLFGEGYWMCVRRVKNQVIGTCTRRKCLVSGRILCTVEVTGLQVLGNTHVEILDFVMKSQVRRKNESGAA